MFPIIKDSFISYFEPLWAFLPDKCQVHGCCRKGVRGNEIRLGLGGNHYIIICDYCHSMKEDYEIWGSKND